MTRSYPPRFAPRSADEMSNDPNGGWVKISDYDILLSKNTELELALQQYQNQAVSYSSPPEPKNKKSYTTTYWCSCGQQAGSCYGCSH